MAALILLLIFATQGEVGTSSTATAEIRLEIPERIEPDSSSPEESTTNGVEVEVEVTVVEGDNVKTIIFEPSDK